MATPRVEVGVLGATGPVGQQFIARLAGHLWFRLAWAGASQRSEGKRLSDIAWQLAEPLPDEARHLVVELPAPGRAPRIIFSALDAAVATTLEPAFASAGHIVRGDCAAPDDDQRPDDARAGHRRPHGTRLGGLRSDGATR